MNRRFRTAGALIALLAFSAYFAESVQALACGPDMAAGAHHAQHDGHGDAPEQAPTGTDCPHDMLMSGACSIAFLPAPAAPVGMYAPHEVVLPGAAPVAIDLLIAAPPFHPPRA